MTDAIADSLNAIIGFSAYDVFRERHERRENGVYIADTSDALERFLSGGARPVENCRFDAVSVKDVCMDLKDSDGDYYLESKAMERFEKEVHHLGFSYRIERRFEESDGSPGFFAIKVEARESTGNDRRGAGRGAGEDAGRGAEGDAGASSSGKPAGLGPQIEILKDKIKEYNQSVKESLSVLFEKFKNFDGEYPRDAVDLCIRLQDELTPRLIDVLKKVAANPSEWIDKKNDHTHFFALMLLGCFKDTRAHQFIVDLVSLPDGAPQDLFQDVITEDLPVILLRTCGGSLDSIKSLIENKNAETIARSAAVEALVFSVVEGYVERDEVLSYLGAIFRDDKADMASDFGDLLADSLSLLCPVELKETIQDAYEEGLIASGFISYEDFEESFLAGKEKCLERLAIDLKNRSLDDPHGRMSAYALFPENKRRVKLSPGPASPSKKKPAGKTKSRKKKNINKKKRKKKKASKKKNRR